MTREREMLLEALRKGPVKVQIGERTITLKKLGSTYHIIITEPGKRPKAWQYASALAINRFEKHIELMRRDQ